MCRWLERDPAGYQDGPSLYSYLGRNPMAGTDPYGLSFWGDQYDYWFGDRHGEAERTLRENQRLVERHLEEQRRLGIISDRRYLEQSVAMRRDINSVLTEMCLISWEQQEQKLETYVAITITMLPVGEVVVGARALGAASVRTGTAAATAETAVAVRNTAMPVRYGPLDTGPLPEAVAKTFRGGSYTGTVISEAMTLYRVHGGTAGELGLYWTRTAPMGPLQSQIDLAILSAWGNTATRVTTIRVPPGTLIFDGFAAGQGGLLGGGSQVVIPNVNPSWIIR